MGRYEISEHYYGILEPDGTCEMWDDYCSAKEVWDEGLPRPTEGSKLVQVETVYVVIEDKVKP